MIGNTVSCPVIYLVQMCSGQYEDYREHHIFATVDKERAERWCDKYNRIIENNKDRISHYYDDGNYDKPEPFWYSHIIYDSPIAIVEEIEFR